MNIDLRQVPFSRCGAYMTFSMADERLYLRTVHGGAQAVAGGRLALVEPLVNGIPSPFESRVSPAALDLHTPSGKVLSLTFQDPFTLRVHGEGSGLRLTVLKNESLAGLPQAIAVGEGRWRLNCPAHQVNLLLTPLIGQWRINAEQMTVDLPEEDGGCEAAIEEYTSAWRPRMYEGGFDQCRVEAEADFLQWLEQTPTTPPEYTEARRLAAYVNWSSVVEPVGHLLRPSMLMSKNWMTSVWAWDHCFNAMALTYRKPMTGWDQFMTLFDQQDEFGALPDFINDRGTMWNYCKPPIHGWVLGWMMEHTQFVRPDQVRQIYGPLARWTEWWFRYRDSDHDGIPEYHHGNDSGWDNATPFSAGVPLESPDLCAFLVLQMETLAKLAAMINNNEESESWQRRSEELLQNMLAHFWQGDHFVALRSGDHLVADTDSLLLYLPIILGHRLPNGMLSELIGGLMRQGRFLTRYGMATESPASSAYDPDGYWRGPIWAPPTLFIVEGLAAAGEMELAREIARRFCDMCAKQGFAENFNALTGQPLRDPAYTWTSSIFLVLAHEYLMEEE